MPGAWRPSKCPTKAEHHCSLSVIQPATPSSSSEMSAAKSAKRSEVSRLRQPPCSSKDWGRSQW